MEIDAALILGGLVLKIIREPGNRGELVPGCWIEIRVSAAGIDGTVPEAKVGKACRTVVSDRDITGYVSHEVMDPGIPLQGRQRIQITETSDGIVDTVRTNQTEWRYRSCQSAVHVR